MWNYLAITLTAAVIGAVWFWRAGQRITINHPGQGDFSGFGVLTALALDGVAWIVTLVAVVAYLLFRLYFK